MIPGGLALICLLGGGALVMAGRHVQGEVAASSTWPSTDGVVVKSSSTLVDYRDPKSGQLGKRAIVDFAYTYTVDGQSYTGSKLAPSLAIAQPVDMVAKYPMGANVKVFYDPAAPSDAALEVADVSDGSTPFFVIGGILFVIGLPFVYLSYRMAIRGPDR